MSKSTVVYEGGRWYVYALLDPIELRKTGSPLLSVIYVGKGVKDRADQHVKDERNKLREALARLPMSGSKSERIQWLLGSGEEIPAIVLTSGLFDERDAYKAEALAMELVGRLLAAYGLDPLGNTTPGHGQSAGMAILGQPHVLGGPKGPTLIPAAVANEPLFVTRSVRSALLASTSRRVDWRSNDVVPHRTILVKGTAGPLSGGHHARLDASYLPARLQDVADKITAREDEFVPGSQFERTGYDPDEPWSDHEARERATRYWPFASTAVRGWLLDPATRPVDLLLAVPGAGETTVRYAWQIDYGTAFEYFPRSRRWGIPLGEPLVDHPARGRCLTEDRGTRTGVQVLANYVSGCRLLEPER